MHDPTSDLTLKKSAHHILTSFHTQEWQDKEPQLEDLCVKVFEMVTKEYPCTFEVSVVFTNNEEIQTLNEAYRAKRSPTNVLSFPSGLFSKAQEPQPYPIPLGDVVLALETIEWEAASQKKTFHDHLVHLLVHGFLHLFGLDHETEKEAQEMENREITYLKYFGIDNPYLLKE
jgi:probable rRNA maturation factor